MRKDKRIDSPTPATDPGKGKPTTVDGLVAGDQRIKVSSGSIKVI